MSFGISLIVITTTIVAVINNLTNFISGQTRLNLFILVIRKDDCQNLDLVIGYSNSSSIFAELVITTQINLCFGHFERSD